MSEFKFKPKPLPTVGPSEFTSNQSPTSEPATPKAKQLDGLVRGPFKVAIRNKRGQGRGANHIAILLSYDEIRPNVYILEYMDGKIAEMESIGKPEIIERYTQEEFDAIYTKRFGHNLAQKAKAEARRIAEMAKVAKANDPVELIKLFTTPATHFTKGSK